MTAVTAAFARVTVHANVTHFQKMKFSMQHVMHLTLDMLPLRYKAEKEMILNLLISSQDVVASIHQLSVEMGIEQGCGMTLSFGEQTPETYERWAEASGNRKALRYLLRIESSNPVLFDHLHYCRSKHRKTLPARYQALKDLRAAGYQVGTGVMIGVPTQTIDDLVQDIRTFEMLDIDMLGMGPYLVSHGGDMIDEGMMEKAQLLTLTRNMLATTRLALPDCNIAAATALETLQPGGRALGVLCGCNVIMPNVTPQNNRPSYQLYDNKQGTVASPDANVLLEQELIQVTGRTIARATASVLQSGSVIVAVCHKTSAKKKPACRLLF